MPGRGNERMGERKQERKKAGEFQKIIYFSGVVLFFCGILLFGRKVYASSASVSFSTDSSNVDVGNTFTVTVIAESSVGFRDFDCYIAYNAAILKYIDGDNNVSGSNGLLRIKDIHNKKTVKMKQYILKFQGVSAGTSEIYVSDKVYLYEAKTGEEMSISKNTISINVNQAMQLNDDASLELLQISKGTLSPAFEPRITEYKTEVSSKTKTLFINARAKDGNATVVVTGNDALKKGDNEVTIKVTAPSGKEQIYTIHVKRDTKQEEAYQKEEEEMGETVKEEEKDFTVFTEKGSIFLKMNGKYEVITKEVEEIPDGYEKNSLVIQGMKIPVYTLKKDPENDFVLIYGRNSNGDANFYQYDRIEKTLQKYSGGISVTQQDKPEATETLEEQSELEKTYQSKLMTMKILLLLTGSLAALFLLGMIKMYLSRREREYEED